MNSKTAGTYTHLHLLHGLDVMQQRRDGGAEEGVELVLAQHAHVAVLDDVPATTTTSHDVYSTYQRSTSNTMM